MSSSYTLYPTRRKDGDKEIFIEFGNIKYKYINALKLQSGEVKEYYKCVDCPARLQYFKKTHAISLTTKHNTSQCCNNLDKWKRKMEKIRKFSEKSLMVIQEDTELDSFTGLAADSLNSMFESTIVGPKTSSEEGEEVYDGRNKSFFEKTIYPDVDTSADEDEDGEITTILDETVSEVENIMNFSPIRPAGMKPVYIPTPRRRPATRSFSGRILSNVNQYNNTTNHSNNHKLTFQLPSNSSQVKPKKQVRFSDSPPTEKSFVSRVLKK